MSESLEPLPKRAGLNASPMADAMKDVTRLLGEAGDGGTAVRSELYNAVYGELRMLAAIVEAAPLQVVELAQRLNVPATNISKHITVLRRAGIVTNDRPKLYGIAPEYQVPGQPALDFGVCLLRLDRLSAS